MNEEEKTALLGLTLPELTEQARIAGLPAFAGRQLADWVYRKKVRSIDEMTNLSLRGREALKARCRVGASDPVERHASVDGTVKYLYRTAGGGYVESVFIPDGERATLCVSSQVGCRMGCRFCMTGRQGFGGHLTATDILNQLYALPERERLTNVVFMGQGEPMDNIDNVLRATELLTATYAYAWSPRRITVSTVGLRKGLKRFLDESECHLAVSLHNPFGNERAALMPAEKGFPLAELLALLRRYDFSGQRRLSFEYTVFGGVNDSPAHARELVRLLGGWPCRVNLIRFHTIPGTELHGAPEQRMNELRDYLTAHGVFTTVRASRGEDIFAACGLLTTARQTSGGDRTPESPIYNKV